MPLPDERRGRRASELVSLFQQRIDTDATEPNASLSPTPLVRSISRGSQGGLSPHSLSASLPSRRLSSVSNELKPEDIATPRTEVATPQLEGAIKAKGAPSSEAEGKSPVESNAAPKQATPVRAAKKPVAPATFPRRAASESTAEVRPAVASASLKKSVNSPTASFLAKNRIGASPKTTKEHVSGTSSASTSKAAETSSLRRGASRSESNGSPVPRKPVAKARESPLSKPAAQATASKPRTSSTLNRPTAASATRTSKATAVSPSVTKSDQPKPSSSTSQTKEAPKRETQEPNNALGIPKDSPAGKAMSKVRLGGALARSSTPKLSNPGASPSISAAVTKKTSVTSRMGPSVAPKKEAAKKPEVGQAANVVSKTRIGRPGASGNKPVGPVGKVDLTKKKRPLMKDEGKKDVEVKKDSDAAKESTKDAESGKKQEAAAKESTAATEMSPPNEQETKDVSDPVEESRVRAKDSDRPTPDQTDKDGSAEAPSSEDNIPASAAPTELVESEPAQHPRAASDPQPISNTQAESTDQGISNTFSTLSVSSSASPPPSDMPDMETDNEEDSREVEGQPSTKPSSPSDSFHRSLAPSPSPIPQTETVKVESEQDGQSIPIIVNEVKDTKRFNEWGSREGGPINIPPPARSVSPAASSPAGSQKKVPIWMRKGGAVESTSTPSTPTTPASPLP